MRTSTTIAVRFWKLPLPLEPVDATSADVFLRAVPPFQPSSKYRLLENALHFHPRNLSSVANRVSPRSTRSFLLIFLLYFLRIRREQVISPILYDSNKRNTFDCAAVLENFLRLNHQPRVIVFIRI